VHCSRVFRSSAPSDLLPSSPGRCRSGTAQGECGSTRSMEWGVGPGGGVPHRGCCPAGRSPARHIPEGTVPGPVRSQGEGPPDLVAGAQHAAIRLECTRADISEFSPSGRAGSSRPRLRSRRLPEQALAASASASASSSAEVPRPVPEQLASWPPSTNQPTRRVAASLSGPANPLDKRVHSCVLACCKDQAA